MGEVFLNGRFVDAAGAAVPAFDAGFQHGVGLFETMTGGVGAGGPWAAQVEEHVERLVGSARELGLSDDARASGLAEAVLETVRRAGLARCRVRLTFTGGDLNLLSSSRGGAEPAMRPTVMAHAQPVTPYPEEMFERGVSAVLSDLRVNPLDPTAGHKTLNYWARLRELRTAASKRAGEALVFSVTNHLAGGCVSNCVLVRREGARLELHTPIARGEEDEVASLGDGLAAQQSGGRGVLPSPVLPGVTRGWLLELAPRMGFTVVRRMLSIDDVLSSGEVLLTNSSWGVLPVVKVEREAIGDGVVGPVAKQLRREWLAMLDNLGSL